MTRTRTLALVAALLMAASAPPAVASASRTGGAATAVPVASLPGASGSTIGPGGDLFVASPASGTIFRIDRRTRAVTTFHEGLPPQVLPLGGVMDVAFLGRTAYVLITLVGPDVGGSHTDGIYRLDGPATATPIADIGAWSIAHPPNTVFFVPTGVQYAMQPYHGGFLVTDGHHNRVLRVGLDGAISELAALENIVPTGLDVRGRTVLLAEAGPVPHLPANGKVVAIDARTGAQTRTVASGAPLVVDVERGRGSSLFAVAQGMFLAGGEPGSPAEPNTGSLLEVMPNGSFHTVVDGLDRPTSLEVQGDTAFVVGLGGAVLAVAVDGD